MSYVWLENHALFLLLFSNLYGFVSIAHPKIEEACI